MRANRPLPWADDQAAPRALADALREGRADRPSEAQIARMIEAVTLAPSPVSPESRDSVQAASTPASVALKLIGAVILVTALLAAGVMLWPHAGANEPRSVPPVQRRQHSLQVARPGAHVPTSAPSESIEPQLLQEPVAKAIASSGAAKRVRNPHPERPREAGSLEDDLALLSRARRALSHAPQRALALIEEHERTFENSAFAHEREALAVEALFAAGRTSQATSRAAAFRQHYPDSPYKRRIDARIQAP